MQNSIILDIRSSCVSPSAPLISIILIRLTSLLPLSDFTKNNKLASPSNHLTQIFFLQMISPQICIYGIPSLAHSSSSNLFFLTPLQLKFQYLHFLIILPKYCQLYRFQFWPRDHLELPMKLRPYHQPLIIFINLNLKTT